MKRIFILVAILMAFFNSRSVFAQGDTLRPGDNIEIRLAGVPADEVAQFSAPQTIDASGSVNLPYIGLMKIAGLAANQAQALIENKLKADKIYTSPTITISLPTGGRFVNIGGAVRAPGRIPYTPDLTLMTAINAAGSFNDFADKKRVTLKRNGTKRVIDTRKIDKDPSLDEKVLPGDQIDVPQSLW